MYSEQFNVMFDSLVEDNNINFYNAPQDTIYWEWSTGGASGGNCWGDDASPLYGEEPPSETPLDKFLQKNFPNIPLVVYKKICSEVTHGQRCNSEYYGNYEDFSTCFISKEKLYKLLKEYKCI